MSRRVQVIVGVVAIAAAVALLVVVRQWSASLVTTAKIVTPVEPIAVGALIENWMLGEREVPRPLLGENVYVQRSELVGKVAVVPLMPGMVVYRIFAVEASEYRLVEDPTLEVVSFPVDPDRAVGGQLQPNHRVNIWELWAVNPKTGMTLTEVAATEWGTATLLVKEALVVDVRASGGQAVARQPQAVPGQVSGSGSEQRVRSGTLQIVTVAVPRDVAHEILALVASESAGAELWVSLAPLEDEVLPEIVAMPAGED
jgi:hypothetical protein